MTPERWQQLKNLYAVAEEVDGPRKRFADRGMSQSVFGQYITVADDASLPQPRLAETSLLGELATPDPNDIPIVAVLGGEGVGKTWLVAQWWLMLPEAQIMLLVTWSTGRVSHPGQTSGESRTFNCCAGRRLRDGID
jgi:hypothetical protein